MKSRHHFADHITTLIEVLEGEGWLSDFLNIMVFKTVDKNEFIF